MIHPLAAITAYILAKDGNRPHLLEAAFADDARLQMQLRSEATSLPAEAVGRDEIADTLVRRFNQTYENVYTWCLGALPDAETTAFACAWLVTMSDKQSREVRLGCGRYNWRFAPGTGRVQSLAITIECMEVMPAETLHTVMAWAASLAYPWCPVAQAVEGVPPIAGIRQVVGMLPNLAR